METGWLRHEARRLNERQNLPRTLGSYSVTQFWQSAHEHFMVLGGDRRIRRSILLRKLACNLSGGTGSGAPTLVITNDPELGGMATGLPAPKGSLLVASGSRYPNYDFFYGMSSADIARFFGEQARSDGYARPEEVSQYAGGLLAVLNSFVYPSLTTIRKLMQYPDEQIRNKGLERGVTKTYLLDALVSCYQGGKKFREIADAMAVSFRTLGSGRQDKTGINLLTTVAKARKAGAGGLHVVDVGGLPGAMINRYLAAELQYIISSRVPFDLIVDGLMFDQNDALNGVINAVRNAGTGTVGILMGNPWRSFQRKEELQGYPAMILLPQGDELDSDSLTRIRQVFGQYTHHDVVRRGGWLTRRGSQLTSYARDRVSMEDTQRNQAICQLTGNGEIYLVRSLRD